MEINKEYKLKDTAYYKRRYKKKQIVVGNTLNVGLEHFDIWTKAISGKYKGTSPYTIALDGTIYEHYNPAYYSEFLKDEDLDKRLISIVLENEGWLKKDFHQNGFISWNGDIYNRDEEIHERKWRGKHYWAPYSEKQMESLAWLCSHLIDKFKLTTRVSSDNIILGSFALREGVYFRSNYTKSFLDVSPAFDFKYLKEKVENYEIERT